MLFLWADIAQMTDDTADSGTLVFHTLSSLDQLLSLCADIAQMTDHTADF
jgi:hypothetical protein